MSILGFEQNSFSTCKVTETAVTYCVVDVSLPPQIEIYAARPLQWLFEATGPAFPREYFTTPIPVKPVDPIVAPVPEPATAILLLASLVLVLCRRRLCR